VEITADLIQVPFQRNIKLGTDFITTFYHKLDKPSLLYFDEIDVNNSDGLPLFKVFRIFFMFKIEKCENNDF